MPAARKPKITALAPWYGSKRMLAPRIVRQLGPHKAYFEPFCGSMAVLFAKPPCRHEVVNDLNRDIVNIARVLQSKDSANNTLLTRLHFTLAAEDIYRESHAVMQEPFVGPLGDADRAYHALCNWWLGRNGLAGARKSACGFAARYSSVGGNSSVRFRSMVSSIPAFMTRLARVDVLNRDGLKLIGKIKDVPTTVIYCDPPYLTKTAQYDHDFVTEDHTRLAQALNRFQHARVVVSYYPHPLLESLYPADRWQRIEIVVNKRICNTDMRSSGAVKATELLLVNGPIVEG